MRAVVQRVREARIRVAGDVVGEMGPGALALVGVGRDDDTRTAVHLAHKLVHLRIFEDEQGRMNRSLLETRGTLGVVSQFTLYGDVRRGRRPSYVEAAPAEDAEALVAAVAQGARDLGIAVVTGRFRAHMEMELVNVGPVTILVDTEKRF